MARVLLVLAGLVLLVIAAACASDDAVTTGPDPSTVPTAVVTTPPLPVTEPSPAPSAVVLPTTAPTPVEEATAAPTATPTTAATVSPVEESTAEPPDAATAPPAPDPTTPVVPPAVATSLPASSSSQSALIANGAEVYTLNCARCHAENGLGTAQYSAPLIGVGAKYSTQGMIEELTNGHPVTFGFADRLTADEIAQVVAYVKASFP